MGGKPEGFHRDVPVSDVTLLLYAPKPDYPVAPRNSCRRSTKSGGAWLASRLGKLSSSPTRCLRPACVGYCFNYRPSARMGCTPDTGMSHVGFRCVITPKMRERTGQ
jgi:hypothetical protein